MTKNELIVAYITKWIIDIWGEYLQKKILWWDEGDIKIEFIWNSNSPFNLGKTYHSGFIIFSDCDSKGNFVAIRIFNELGVIDKTYRYNLKDFKEWKEIVDKLQDTLIETYINYKDNFLEPLIMTTTNSN